MAAISPVVESIAAVLVDNGYYSEAAVNSVEGQCTSRGTPVVYAATGRRRHGRSILELEDHPDPPTPPPGTATADIMAHRLATREGKALYGQRKTDRRASLRHNYTPLRNIFGFWVYSLITSDVCITYVV